MKRIIMLLFVVMSLGITANAQEGVKFEELTFKEALAKAKAENKLVFMDCYTSWCAPCKRMLNTVFVTKEAGDFFNPRFVSVKYDMEKDGSNYHGTLAELYWALGNKQKAEEHQKIDEQKQKEAEERFRKMFEKKE